MAGDETKATYQTMVHHLSGMGYTFVCPSPETQSRVVHKRVSNPTTKAAESATDFFGWNLACTRDVLQSFTPDGTIQRLQDAGIVTVDQENQYRSTVRISNFYLPSTAQSDSDHVALYYIHSSFPATSDSVFFGPDTYLFVSFLQAAAQLIPRTPKLIVDVCCGSGAGAIHLAKTYSDAKVLGLDLNPRALGLGAVNAHLAGCEIDFNESDLYVAVSDVSKAAGVDLIVSNPPYIAASPDGKDLPIYADGGANFGLDISTRIVEEGIEILSSIGVIIIYTGVAIPTANPGYDPFWEKLQAVDGAEVIQYTILHPDMWAEEIGKGAYADVGRIQVVGAVIRKRGQK